MSNLANEIQNISSWSLCSPIQKVYKFSFLKKLFAIVSNDDHRSSVSLSERRNFVGQLLCEKADLTNVENAAAYCSSLRTNPVEPYQNYLQVTKGVFSHRTRGFILKYLELNDLESLFFQESKHQKHSHLSSAYVAMDK